MRNNLTQNKVLAIVLIALLIGSVIINLILTDNNRQLQYQVELRDSTINKINLADSALCEQSKKNSETIKKYINNCKFILNGKEVTAEEIILYTRKIYDSLKVYKAFYNLTKKKLKVDFSLSKINNGKILTLEVPQDTLKKYKILYELAEKKYGFKYITKIRNHDLIILHKFTKVDSAMMIYDYYRDKLVKDKNGNWMIIIEKDKKN